MQTHLKNSAQYYINGILQKDRIIFSKAITLIESTKKEDEIIAAEVIEFCLNNKKNSKRIAISGAPGVGKSTFINSFGKLLLDENHSLAVLAIDPSSNESKGSILGDKTRMEDLIRYSNCFIRPTASNNKLGGTARTSYETIILCEAFGFDYIFLETVGVGQSETMASNMVDLFLLLLLPNAGDELQGIKRGIMEMADIILINKSDIDNNLAKIAAAQVKQAIHLFSENEKNWIPQVLNISAQENIGLSELNTIIPSYFLKIETSGYLEHQRKQQDLFWLEEAIFYKLQQSFTENASIAEYKETLKQKILQKEITAIQAAKIIVEKFLNNK